ncbi:MAG: HAD family hydrolase [Lactimicrobium sp.]|uniref:HAD family hydrolase n=1 Tax=Lactimicrobium sp. TaxID=2563780 RepID=UPI002F35611C
MRQYDNYIFDFYGTLVDILTDENSQDLWRRMAEFYSCYGADYKPKILHEEYLMMVHDEENILRKKKQCNDVEINLGRVFARLLLESPFNHYVSLSVCGRNVYDLRRRAHSETIDEIAESEWAIAVGNFFRILSRKHLRVYPHTSTVLRSLKRRGAKIILFTNAQALLTMPEIDASGLKRYFDAIYVSSDYGLRKPSAAFLQQLVKEQDLEIASTLLIGNETDTDIRCALQAGMDAVLLHGSREDEKKLHSLLQQGTGTMPMVKTAADIRILEAVK